MPDNKPSSAEPISERLHTDQFHFRPGWIVTKCPPRIFGNMDDRDVRRTVVAALGRADGGVTPDELLLVPEVEAAVDHRGTLYEHLAHLVAVGVVDRRPSPRGPRFRLTRGGLTTSGASRFAPRADGGDGSPP